MSPIRKPASAPVTTVIDRHEVDDPSRAHDLVSFLAELVIARRAKRLKRERTPK